MRGSMASARASATRWRWPPESCDGIALLETVELDEVEQLHRRACGSRPCAAAALRGRTVRPKAMLSKTRHVAEEGVVLEDEADVALLDGEAEGILAAEEDAAGGREIETGENAQERRLAGARRTEQRHQFARA